MEVTESITRAALDTLSGQIAVLDEDGRILFTNSSWGDVSDATTSSSSGDPGRNYFDSVDLTDDEYAAQAVEGLQAVLDGDRDSFRFEYPCHSPDEKRWFLMRVTSFTLGQQTFATVAHIDITDRRMVEQRAQEHAEEATRERRSLEHILDRINDLIGDVTRILVESVSRDEIEQRVCERLTDADPYVSAWVADGDFPEEHLEPRAVAGRIDIESSQRQLGESASDPSARALVDRETNVVQQIEDDDYLDQIYRSQDVDSLIAIPLSTRDAVYGVITVCADEPGVFDEREQLVLEALGRATANAINAAESKRMLTTDQIVEMEFTIDDPTLFESRLSAETGCTLAYSGSVYGSGGGLQSFYTVQDATVETVLATAGNFEDVAVCRRLTDGEASLCQFTLQSSLIATLIDRGAVTQDVTVTDGIARFTVELPQEADAKSLFEFLSDRFERTDLIGYHEHERPVQTRQEFRGELEDELTDRQLTALRTAYHSGFFNWPRTVDGDELAEMMDISRSTFHQHLRVAERKVLDAFFQTPDTTS